MAAKLKKVGRRLYELVGVTDARPRFPGAPACGGQIRAEWDPGCWDVDTDLDGNETPRRLPPSWECFCVKCLDCDTNGWPTLRDCVREAPKFWMGLSNH